MEMGRRVAHRFAGTQLHFDRPRCVMKKGGRDPLLCGEWRLIAAHPRLHLVLHRVESRAIRRFVRLHDPLVRAHESRQGHALRRMQGEIPGSAMRGFPSRFGEDGLAMLDPLFGRLRILS